jgi:hypothetical protein
MACENRSPQTAGIWYNANMKKFAAYVSAFLLAGCLGSAPKAPAYWTIDVESAEKATSVVVCAPYGGQRLAVLRGNGSIAFDPCNSFAAAPAAILKDALVARGGSGAVTVRRIALDCREEGRRDALVELDVALGDKVASGAASVSAADGNYTAAFTRAFARAHAEARKGLASGK